MELAKRRSDSSDLVETKPRPRRVWWSSVNYAVGTWRRLYNALCNLNIRGGSWAISSPGGLPIATSSCSSPFKKALLTSNYLISNLFVNVILRMIWDVVGLTIGLNVWLKLRTKIWWNPLATRRALYLYTVPSGFSFILNTHLQPVGFLQSGKGTND